MRVDGDAAVEGGSAGGGPEASDDEAAVEPREPTRPRRRRHRRAVGGTVPPAPEPEPATGARSPDDLDVGWGEGPDGPDDDRFLREVPPHW